jgi:putative membrane protein
MNIRTSLKAVSRVAILGLLAMGAAHAQIGNPGGATPTQPPSHTSAAPLPQQPNNTDRLFVLLAGAGGLGEVQLARLADGKATSPAVKQFAQRMAQDHGRSNAYLAEAARRAGVTVPGEPGPDEKTTLQQLQALQGRDFDVAYLRSQLVDHQKTVQLLQWEAGQGQHAELQRYAMTVLPDVIEHLAMVQALLADATGTLPSGLAQASRHKRTTH